MKKLIKEIILESKVSSALEYSRNLAIKDFGLDNILNTAMRDDSPQLDAAGFDRKKPKEPEKLQEWKAKNIPIVMSLLEEADSTKGKGYVPMIVKIYAKASIDNPKAPTNYRWGAKVEDVQSKVAEAIYLFDIVKQAGKMPEEYRDHMRFKDFFSFVEVAKREYTKYNIEKSRKKELQEISDAEKEERKGKYEYVWVDDKIKIVRIYDYKASCYFGYGSSWCTQASGPYASSAQSNFRYYGEGGRHLYIIFPGDPEIEQVEKRRANGEIIRVMSVEKYQINFLANGELDLSNVKDAQDHNYSPRKLFKERFGDLSEIFVQIEPGIQKMLMFAPNYLINQIVHDMKVLSLNKLKSLVETKAQGNPDAEQLYEDVKYAFESIDPNKMKANAKENDQITALEPLLPELLKQVMVDKAVPKSVYGIIHNLYWFMKFRLYIEKTPTSYKVSIRSLEG